MKALVTGAGGFLGLYIVEQLLAAGHEVRGLCRRRYPALEALKVETLQGDVQDADAVRRACRGIDCVFHVAALAGIGGPSSRYFGVNTLGTRNVLAACRAEGVRRLIYTSTPSVTFSGGDQRGVDESAPYSDRWLAHYPHSKALAEQEVLQANGPELVTCALRPHLIWGPRDNHLLPRIVQRARSGRLRRVGDGTNLIDVCYVENAAEAHLLAANALAQGPSSPAAGRAYFISQGEPVNCWDFVNRLLDIAGLPPVRKSISAGAAYRVGAVCEAIYKLLRLNGEPPMTRFLAAELAHSHYFDLSRARADLGYGPQIALEEGLRRLHDWLRAQSDEPAPA